MELSQKQKSFSGFVFEFLKGRLNFEHLKTKMIVIADVFPKLRTPKYVVNSICKKSPFRGHFGKQHVRETKHF